MHDCRHDHYSLLKGAAKGNDRFMSEHSILLSKSIPQWSQKNCEIATFEFWNTFHLHETSTFLTYQNCKLRMNIKFGKFLVKAKGFWHLFD